MLTAEAGHLQGIGDATTGFLGQCLQHGIAVVVGNQHGILLLQLGGDFSAKAGLLLGRQRLGLLGGEVGLDQDALGDLRHDGRTCKLD
ncbi:hypothetical protein D3C77_552400 [compost metagenome]